MPINRLPVGQLSRNIMLAFLIFGLLFSLGLGFSLISGLRSIEQEIVDRTLNLELAHFRNQVETAADSDEFHSRTTIIHITPLDSLDDLPESVRRLAVGIHDVAQAGREYRVLVEEIDGIRYTVQFDDTNIHARERQFIRWVLLSAAVALLLSGLVGWWIASRLSWPSQRLAKQIQALGEQSIDEFDPSLYGHDEIGVLAHRLHAYHIQLKDLLQREKEFAGNVSHELRTPVTTISLAAEVLASKSDLSPKDAEKIKRIERATREISELIETFLILSQVGVTPGVDYKKCDIKPLVEDVIEQQRAWLGDKPVQVSIVCTAALVVAAPPRVLSVLLANLVRNAFRYTNEGSITVMVATEHVTVVDTGIGIDTHIQSKMFERSSRGNHDDHDGAGLGLSIVQRICDRYGWRVFCRHSDSGGSTFEVNFADKNAPAVCE